jgi:alginate O-acetyltransferase complex protein AlgI
MLFNSFLFILLLPPAAASYFLLRRWAPREVSQSWLLLLSLSFYAHGALRQLPLLLGSILFNWAISQKLAPEVLPDQPRKRLLIFALAVNILFLSLFKYVNFFLGQVRPLLGFHFALPSWALPLGISFITLNQVMYLVDTYEGIVRPNSLLDHASFVSFFPYVIAGPLTRAKLMVNQLHEDRTATSTMVAQGLAFFIIGLFKKVVLADSLIHLADTAFNDPAHTGALETWISVIAYSLQLYFDFSGYSDMAVGVARMFGYTIPFNFNAPYTSKSIIEFWQRWHISLSSFITTYLYTPILRGFKGRATVKKAAVASVLAMAISGLWHGAGWTFVLWGLGHGIALGLNQYWRKTLKKKMSDPVGWVVTILFVTLIEIFFRARNVPNAMLVFGHLIPVHGMAAAMHLRELKFGLEGMSYIVPSMLAIPLALLGPSSQEIVEQFRPRLRSAIAYAAVGLVSIVFLNSVAAKTFVYFGF